MKSIARKISWLFVLTLIGGFLSYVIRIIIAKKLSVADYGLFYAVFSFVFFFAPFRDLGLSESAIFFINKYSVKKDNSRIKSVIVYSALSQFITSIFFALILFLLRSFLVKYYFKNQDSSLILVLFLLSFIFLSLAPLIGNIFRAREKFGYFKFMDILKSSFFLIFVLFFFKYSSFVTSLIPVFAFVVSSILTFVVSLFLLFYYFKDIFYSSMYKSTVLFKQLFSFGLPILFSSAAGLILTYSDTILLTVFRSLDEVGLYNAAYPGVFIIIILVSPISQFLLPRLSTFFHNKNKIMIIKMMNFVYNHFLIFLLPLALIFFSFANLILGVLFGSSYLPAVSIFKIFAIGSIFIFLWNINSAFFTAIGKAKERLYLVLIVSGLNLLLGLFLVPLFGLYGASITTVFSFFLLSFISFIYLFKDFSFRINFWSQLKIIFSSIIFIVSLNILKSIISLNIYLESFIIIFISGLVYLGVLFLFNILNKEKLRFFKSLLSLK